MAKVGAAEGRQGRASASWLYRKLRFHRSVVEPLTDGVVWAVALLAADLLRYQSFARAFTGSLAGIVVIAAVTQLVVGFADGLYRVRWRVGSFEQMLALSRTIATATGVIAAVDLITTRHVIPVSATIGGGIIALVLTAGIRSVWRLNWERKLRPAGVAERALVFGAGEGGSQVINALLADPGSPYVPVGLLDDDPNKRNSALRHLRVLGNRDSLPTIAKALAAETVIVAIPSADASLIRDLSERAAAAQLTVKVLPAVTQLLTDSVGVDDIRPVTEEDLLGRRVIDTEVASIAGYLTGRRVLVTGAGGSIGSELCRQINMYGPARLVMLDRDESGLHQVQLSIEGRALLDDRALVVCDIRDPEALRAVFAEHRPEVVFHAAALKHLPLLEMWPAEAIKTNIQGTVNVLSASEDVGVERFVNISTDKAANPCSVLGYTKRLAERLTAGVAETATGTFISVRFGNVLGSRGSVLTAFRQQIALGGPVTVTHPDVTRYFMTVEEAVELVIQAGAVGSSGEVLVLDMGTPVKIADVAQRLVLEASAPISIVYTGLRQGEKLHEDLFGEGETDTRPRHPLISHASVPARHVGGWLETLDVGLTPQALKRLLADETTADLAGSTRRSES